MHTRTNANSRNEHASGKVRCVHECRCGAHQCTPHQAHMRGASLGSSRGKPQPGMTGPLRAACSAGGKASTQCRWPQPAPVFLSMGTPQGPSLAGRLASAVRQKGALSCLHCSTTIPSPVPPPLQQLEKGAVFSLRTSWAYLTPCGNHPSRLAFPPLLLPHHPSHTPSPNPAALVRSPHRQTLACHPLARCAPNTCQLQPPASPTLLTDLCAAYSMLSVSMFWLEPPSPEGLPSKARQGRVKIPPSVHAHHPCSHPGRTCTHRQGSPPHLHDMRTKGACLLLCGSRPP